MSHCALVHFVVSDISIKLCEIVLSYMSNVLWMEMHSWHLIDHRYMAWCHHPTSLTATCQMVNFADDISQCISLTEKLSFLFEFRWGFLQAGM